MAGSRPRIHPSRRRPLEGTWATKLYERLLKRAGLPRQRFHNLRHTCATLLLVQGEDLRVVMEVLGHSSVNLTANTYRHVAQSLKRRAAGRMEALFGAGG